jgi:hypothetical protein
VFYDGKDLLFFFFFFTFSFWDIFGTSRIPSELQERWRPEN